METTVTLDGTVSFPATVDPNDRWNGFLNPRFTRQVAEKVIGHLNTYSAETGEEWFFHGPESPHHPAIGVEYTEYPPDFFKPDSDGLYACWTHGYCWTQTD